MVAVQALTKYAVRTRRDHVNLSLHFNYNQYANGNAILINDENRLVVQRQEITEMAVDSVHHRVAVDITGSGCVILQVGEGRLLWSNQPIC